LCGLDLTPHPDLLVGLSVADDAGVLRLNDELALIQTVDFFTPIVDEPELFGRIAVANALSDVYAMGGRPVCAMNVVGFPREKLPMEQLQRCLAGGLDKLRQAEVALAGGHSVDNPEFLYGLAVSGLVHPQRILTKGGARDGDALVLTKPLGTGIVTTALKGGLADPQAVSAATRSMEALNRAAAERMAECEVHACTDVTGFGLLGHAAEMLVDGAIGLEFDARALPLLPGVEGYAAMGLLPAGLHRNRAHIAERVEVAAAVPTHVADAAFDPQTSGGLLIALPADEAGALAAALGDDGIATAVVGRATAALAGRLALR
jgi:selenide,water dikinase